MGQPFPPAGNQQQVTERPLRVYAEQYTGGAVPVGVNTDVVPPNYAEGQPRIYMNGVKYDVHVGDWVISNRYTGQPIEVVSNEEFTERFGGGAPLLPEGT